MSNSTKLRPLLALCVSLLPGLATATNLEFNTTGSGEFLNSVYWTPNQVPTITDDVFIRNNGTTVNYSDGPAEAKSVSLGNAVSSVWDNGSLVFTEDLTIANSLLLASTATSEQVSDTLASNAFFHIADTPLFQVSSPGSDDDIHVATATAGTGVSGNLAASLWVENVDTAILDDDVKVACAVNDGGGLILAGTAWFRRVDDLSISGDLLYGCSEYSGLNAFASGDLSAGASAMAEDSGNSITFHVGGDLGIGRTTLTAGPGTPFKINSVTGAVVLFENTETFDIDGSVDVGTVALTSLAGAPQIVYQSRGNNLLQFDGIDALTVGGDFSAGVIRGTAEYSPAALPPNFIDVNAIASQFNVASSDVVGAFNVGLIDLTGSGSTLQEFPVYQASGLAQMEYATMSTDGPSTVGAIVGDANIPNADAYGRLLMVGSSLTTPQLRVGVNDNPTGAGTVTGDLTLFPSYINTDFLELGDYSQARFHLWGLDPVDPLTVNSTFAAIENTYPYIDALDGLLTGEITSDFDFAPPAPGTYTFDLVRSTSATALGDTTATLLIADLPPEFCVIFYGIADDGDGDILRLIISTECDAAGHGNGIPEPASLPIWGLLAALLPGLGACRRRLS